MIKHAQKLRILSLIVVGALAVTACGGGDSAPTETTNASVGSETTNSGSTSPDTETTVSPGNGGPETGGGGVILADLCAGGQPLNGAISLEDLVDFGILTSTNATVEGSGAYGATAYETFGFLCNINDDEGTDGNFLTIGMRSGSDIWDLAVDQGDAEVEQMGDWEVMIGSNWLSPLTMRITDASGNQDSLFATWTPSDGSIPDAETLERIMRPLAEAIASRSTVDIPRS